jgi:predicted transcriptional regulator of viral defense system
MAIHNYSIPKELMGSVFTPEKARKNKVSYSKLKRWLKKGVAEKLERGVYRIASSNQEDHNSLEMLSLATARIGQPCAVCLLSALEYYHLTDEISSQVWLLVPRNKRSVHEGFRLVRTSDPQWNIGIEKHQGFAITSLERTLVDALVHTRYLGKMLGIEALKQALSEQKTTLEKVTRMASRLGVFNRIQPVIEVLL